MPTYEYRCDACAHQFEVFARMSDPAPEACEACGGGPLVKVLFPVAVHYKGSGFYKTDYDKPKAPAGAATGGTSGGEGSGSGSADSGGSASDSSSAAPASDASSSSATSASPAPAAPSKSSSGDA